MAALDFPDSPNVGDLYPVPAIFGVPQYMWNGYAWIVSGAGGGGSGGGGLPPSDAIPLMDGVGAAGVANSASRGDHKHPSDTTKADKAYVDSQDTSKVNKAGDVMTGNLTIDSATATATLVLNKHAESTANSLLGLRNGNSRWQMDFGDAAVETGANAGSNFYLRRFSDAGAQTGLALSIYRDSGTHVVGGSQIVQGFVNSSQTAITGTYYFGDGGTRYLTFDGTTFTLNGAPFIVNSSLHVAGPVRSQQSTTTGVYYFGNGNNYLAWDGTNYILLGGNTLNLNQVNASNHVVANVDVYAGAAGTTGTYRFGNAGTAYLTYDATNYTLNGGGLYVNGLIQSNSAVRGVDIQALAGSLISNNNVYVGYSGANGPGTIYWGYSAVKHLTYDGANFVFNGAQLVVNHSLYIANAITTPDVVSTGKGLSHSGSLDTSYTVDSVASARTVAHTGIICIVHNFSGAILVTCHTTGATELYLCGAGQVIRAAGTAVATSCGSAAPENGYVVYNQCGSTAAFGVTTIRTRPAR